MGYRLLKYRRFLRWLSLRQEDQRSMAVRAVECAIINDDKFRNCFGPELSPIIDSQLPQVRLHKQLAQIAKYWVGSFPCKILCGDHWQLSRSPLFLVENLM